MTSHEIMLMQDKLPLNSHSFRKLEELCLTNECLKEYRDVFGLSTEEIVIQFKHVVMLENKLTYNEALSVLSYLNTKIELGIINAPTLIDLLRVAVNFIKE